MEKFDAPISRATFLKAASAGVAGIATLRTAVASTDEKLVTTPKVLGTDRLRGKKAVITGAARGIGRAVAEAFAKEGADIMGLDIAAPVSPILQYPAATREDLEETGRLVKAHGRRFISFIADVRDLPGMRRAAEEAERAMGRVDIIVANAGIQAFASIVDMDDRHWHEIIDVNLTGAANTVRAFAPRMAQRRQGRIILTVSGQGRKGTKHGASYSASKWGMLGLMKSAALDLGEFGITVNAVDPGLTDTWLTRNTARWREAFVEAGKSAPEKPNESEVTAVQKPHSTLGVPWVQPRDVAPLFVFLASDEAAMVSGSAYDVNAGDDAHNAV
jgi:NAD(P)-dependent dehydrogenase (short-subunit alcohol dehydrogenase family)